MNKVLIVIMFILLGTSLIVVSNMNKGVENSFTIEYQNNKNISLPDLTGKEAIAPNLFRLYNNNGVTVDYNIYNGQWQINGTATATFTTRILVYDINETAIIKYYEISGTSNINGVRFRTFNNTGDTIATFLLTNLAQTYIINENTYYIDLYMGSGSTFDNFTFKLQLEQGETATSYVVPKLIPVYKDNLTQQEKNNIGLGAFGGITKIIKTISDIIKPVGDFVNGLLSIF